MQVPAVGENTSIRLGSCGRIGSEVRQGTVDIFPGKVAGRRDGFARGLMCESDERRKIMVWELRKVEVGRAKP